MRCNGQKSTDTQETRGERLREPKSIPIRQMKEDIGRIQNVISLLKMLEPAVRYSETSTRLREEEERASAVRNRFDFHRTEAAFEATIFGFLCSIPNMIVEGYLDQRSEEKFPLSSERGMTLFQEFLSGRLIIPENEGDLTVSIKRQAIPVYNVLLFTRDTFTIMFNLLPTLSRIQKLLTLQTVLLSESSHCSGDSHPFAIALRKAGSEGLVSWKGNEEALDDGPAVELFQRLQSLMSEGYPIPPDFSSFATAHPSWDAFWQIAAWKAVRMEKAIEAVTRELLIEAWKCPEKPLSPTLPDPDMPVASERQWDWVTETEITKPGLPRGGIRPFAYGSGHPMAEILWDPVWDAEHERRSYTDEIPLTFPKDLHTFRCAIPEGAKVVREIIDHPWRWAAEGDLPDFTGLWGGFSREAERRFSGKESVGQTVEGKPITWEDLRNGAEAVYKRGIGMLDHLDGVQEHYRPLRAIDPAEWRDVAETLMREVNPTEMAGRG